MRGNLKKRNVQYLAKQVSELTEKKPRNWGFFYGRTLLYCKDGHAESGALSGKGLQGRKLISGASVHFFHRRQENRIRRLPKALRLQIIDAVHAFKAYSVKPLVRPEFQSPARIHAHSLNIERRPGGLAVSAADDASRFKHVLRLVLSYRPIDYRHRQTYRASR